MIQIFHGNNNLQSRQQLNQLLDSLPDHQIVRLEGKEITQEKINQLSNYQSLYPEKRLIFFDRLFSLTKPQLDKLTPLVLNLSDPIAIWHDKKLTPAQLKQFPRADVKHFPLDDQIFKCLYAIKPNSQRQVVPLFQHVIQSSPFELFLYLLKAHLRKQLSSYSTFSQTKLKNAYLQLIELEFQIKTGKLSISREIALERIILYLIST